MRRPVSTLDGVMAVLGMSPDDRLKPDAAPATGFSLSSGLERPA